VIGARTDALASEGMDGAIARAVAYKDAGADFIFAEAVRDIHQYRSFVEATGLPVLANITEFGQTPLWTVAELAQAGVSLVLYPLSAFRAAKEAARKVFEHLRKDGTQQAVVHTMQTREELYQSIGYYDYERKLDALFGK